jgi:hypothetical protein
VEIRDNPGQYDYPDCPECLLSLMDLFFHAFVAGIAALFSFSILPYNCMPVFGV